MMNSSPDKQKPDAGFEAFVKDFIEKTTKMIRGMMREEKTLLSSGEISLPQFWMLQILAERKSCCMHELAADLAAPPSSVTVMTDRLSEMNLVRRVPDSRDRRAIRVELTPRGKTVLDDMMLQKHKLALKFFHGICPEDREAYLRVVDRVVGRLAAARTGVS